MTSVAHLQVKMTVVRTAETATKHATATGHSLRQQHQHTDRLLYYQTV